MKWRYVPVLGLLLCAAFLLLTFFGYRPTEADCILFALVLVVAVALNALIPWRKS